MNAQCCRAVTSGESRHETSAARTTYDGSQLPTRARRCLDIAGWVVSGAVLVLLPKCPVCLAAYVVMGTGVGLSLTTATALRMVLILLSVATVSYLAGQRGHRFLPLVFLGNRSLGKRQSKE